MSKAPKDLATTSSQARTLCMPRQSDTGMTETLWGPDLKAFRAKRKAQREARKRNR